jgi:hypothetical protein
MQTGETRDLSVVLREETTISMTTSAVRASSAAAAPSVPLIKTAPTKEDHAEQEGIAKKKLAKIKAKREKQRNSSNRRRRVEEAAAAEREETQRSRPSPSRPWKAWPP